jgi:hypothetical protein
MKNNKRFMARIWSEGAPVDRIVADSFDDLTRKIKSRSRKWK